MGDEAQENCRKQITWWSYMHYCFAFILGPPDSQSIAPETSWVAPGPGSDLHAYETTGHKYTSALGMLQGSSKKLCEGYRLPRRDCLGTPCGLTSDMLHLFCACCVRTAPKALHALLFRIHPGFVRLAENRPGDFLGSPGPRFESANVGGHWVHLNICFGNATRVLEEAL